MRKDEWVLSVQKNTFKFPKWSLKFLKWLTPSNILKIFKSNCHAILYKKPSQKKTRQNVLCLPHLSTINFWTIVSLICILRIHVFFFVTSLVFSIHSFIIKALAFTPVSWINISCVASFIPEQYIYLIQLYSNRLCKR